MSDFLLRRIVSLEKQMKAARRASHLGQSSFRGSIDEKDADGNLVGRTGEQHDGTHGSQALDGPVPAMPSLPTVAVAPGSLVISWDGRLVEDDGVTGRPQPLDFQCVEVFFAVGRQPGLGDMAGAITAPAGGAKTFAVPAGDYLIALRSKSTPGRTSALTAVVSATVPAMVSEATIDLIEERLAEARTEIYQSGSDLNQRIGNAFLQGSNAAALANTAQQAAIDAALLASGKGRVVAQATAPAWEENTLWIDTSKGNLPHTAVTQTVTDSGGTADAATTPLTSGSANQFTRTDDQGPNGGPAFTRNSATHGMVTTTSFGQDYETEVTVYFDDVSGNTVIGGLWVLSTGAAASGLIITMDLRRSNTSSAALQIRRGTASAGTIPFNLPNNHPLPNTHYRLWAKVSLTQITIRLFSMNGTQIFEHVLNDPSLAATGDRVGIHAYGVTRHSNFRATKRVWVAVQDTAIKAASDRAGSALTAAGVADGKAVSAAGAAAAAQTTADQATTAAGSAQTKADQAAQEALAAAGLAGSKGEVIYQISAPTGSRANSANLWIRTSDNRPHTYDGNGWVAVTDKTATDAAAAAATAKSAADTAQAAADAAKTRADQAHTLAGTALTNAESAITSANARNAMYRSTSAPSGVANRIGDMWWRFADNTFSQVIGTWMWAGDSWVQSQMAHQVIASVDVGSLTVVGQAVLAQAVIDFLWANVVRAKKITTDMMLVGSGQNLAVDYAMTTADAYSLPTGGSVATTGGRYGGGSLLMASSTSQRIIYTGLQPQYLIPVKPGEEYRISATFLSTVAITAANRVAINVRYLSSTGTWVNTTTLVQNTAAVAANVSVELTGTVVVPANVTHLSVGFVKQAVHNATTRVTEYAVYPMTNASLIVDGAVLARHIDIVSLTAASAFIDSVRSLGIRIVNAAGEVMLDLTGSGEQVLTIPGPNGTPVVSLDNAGRVTGKVVTASDSMLYRGTELEQYWSRMPEGLISIGGFGGVPGSRLYIAANREMGIFDIPMPVLNDRWYRVTVVLATYPSTANPEIEVILRCSPLDQNVVVTPAASPLITSRRAGRFDPSAWDTKTITMWFRNSALPSFATVGSRIRVLLSLYVNGNTYVDANTTMSIEAIGPALPFTQTINQGGATTPPPGSSTAPPAPTPPPSSSEVTYTREWYATQHRSYINDGGGYDGGQQGLDYAMQGYSSYTAGKGRQASLIFFNSPDIRAALAGSTIEAVSIYVKNSSFFAASGGTARIMNHNQDGPGGTSIASMSHVMDVNMARGEGRWIEMPVAFANMLKDGSSRGFGFAALGSSAGQYYGQFEAAPSRIAIRYRK